MDSLFFLATIIGVSLLCLWVMREPSAGRRAGRSPFDMREPAAVDSRPVEEHRR